VLHVEEVFDDRGVGPAENVVLRIVDIVDVIEREEEVRSVERLKEGGLVLERAQKPRLDVEDPSKS
jgi:hypothetical protein